MISDCAQLRDFIRRPDRGILRRSSLVPSEGDLSTVRSRLALQTFSQERGGSNQTVQLRGYFICERFLRRCLMGALVVWNRRCLYLVAQKKNTMGRP